MLIRGQCDKTGARLRQNGCINTTKRVRHCDNMGDAMEPYAVWLKHYDKTGALMSITTKRVLDIGIIRLGAFL